MCDEDYSTHTLGTCVAVELGKETGALQRLSTLFFDKIICKGLMMCNHHALGFTINALGPCQFSNTQPGTLKLPLQSKWLQPFISLEPRKI